MVLSEIFSSDLSEYSLSNSKVNCMYKNQFSGEKCEIVGFFCILFFKLFPSFSDFINSYNCIEKIGSKYNRLNLVLIQKKILT